MNNSPLILLGASIRALANSAGNSGIATSGADLFADRDTQSLTQVTRVTRFPDELFQFARRQPPAPWVYTGGLENYPHLVETLSKTHLLLGNGRDVLEQVRDFDRISAWAAEAGLRTPSQAQDDDHASETTWLVKSEHSAGGRGVRWEQPNAALGSGERRERWIKGRCGSAAFVTCGANSCLLGQSWQFPSPQSIPFAYAGSFVSPDHPTRDAVDALQEFARIAAVESRICGLWGVDFIEDEHQKLHVLEINPRWTASMEVLERQAGRSLIPIHIAACERDDSSLQDAEEFSQKLAAAKGASGKRIVYATESREVSEAWGAWADSQNTLPGRPTIADIPSIGIVFCAGDPICTLLHDDASEARLAEQLDRLQQESWSRLRPMRSHGRSLPLG